MDAESSKTFCAVPWTQVATNASGAYRVCCNALPGKNLVLDNEGQPMRAATHSLEEVWNSPTYLKLRQQLLSSERPEMCTRCFREEDAGIESPRQRWNKRWPDLDDLKPQTDSQARYIDLRLGNLCNLRCRMCNPYASDKWVNEWNAVAEKAQLTPNNVISVDEAKRLRKMDWPSLESTWRNLEPLLQTVEEIYLTGGEPFLSIEHVRLLERLIENGRASEVVIKYNTNLTLLPKRLLDLWPHFQKVKINGSLDGIDGPLHYIRHPANWQEVKGHLQQLMDMRQQGQPLEIGIHTTVQIYNIYHLPELFDVLKAEFDLLPYLNILNHPHCLNIRTLPLKIKETAQARLVCWIKDHPSVANLTKYMFAEDWANHYLSEFFSYTKTLDGLRDESFAQVFPDLWSDLTDFQTSTSHQPSTFLR